MGAIHEEIIEILGKEKVASNSHQFGKRVDFHFLMKACPVKYVQSRICGTVALPGHHHQSRIYPLQKNHTLHWKIVENPICCEDFHSLQTFSRSSQL